MATVRADPSGRRTLQVNERRTAGLAATKGRDGVVSQSRDDMLHDRDEKEEDLGIDSAYRIVKDILDQITLHDSPPINDEVANAADFHLSQRNSPQSNTSTASLSTASHTGGPITGLNRNLTDRGFSRQQHVLPKPTSPPASTGDLSPSGPASFSSLEAASMLSSAPSYDSTPRLGNDTASLWMAQYQRSQTRAEMKMGNVALATLCVRTLDSLDASKVLSPEEFAPLTKPPSPAKVHPSPNVEGARLEIKSSISKLPPSKPQLQIVTDTDELNLKSPLQAKTSPTSWLKKDPPTSPVEKKSWPWAKKRSPDGNSSAPSPPGVIAASRAGWKFVDREEWMYDQPPTPLRGNRRREQQTYSKDPVPTRGVHTVGSGDSTDAVYTRDVSEEDADEKAARESSEVRVGDGVAMSLKSEVHEDLLEDDHRTHGEFNPASPVDMDDITEETEEDIAEEQGVKIRNNAEGRRQGLPRKNVTTDLGRTNGRHEARQVLSPRFQMFGSEYARFLSTSPLAPVTRQTKHKSSIRYSSASRDFRKASGVVKRSLHGSRYLNIEDANDAALTGAITDIIVTHDSQLPPKGFYRISQTGEGDEFTALRRSAAHGGVSGLIPGRRSTQVFINVKKEPNWDRAAQRPCVTALAVIFPDRKEFVPPGFCVVRRYKSGMMEKPGISASSSGSAAAAADLNFGSTGERVFLCYRRSREGNPITGLFPLQPLNNEIVPEGYTVMERTPRNHVADINTGAGAPVFLAFRQRLASLETLRPLPLVLSVHSANPFDNLDDPSGAQGSRQRRTRRSSRKKHLRAYYCTGGTIVASEVGRFHIMDRSTHSLLSPSSISHRLSLIEASRQKTVNSGDELQICRTPTYASSTVGSVLDHDLKNPSEEFVSSATSTGFSLIDASVVSEFSRDEISVDRKNIGRSSSHSSLDQSLSTLSVGSQHSHGSNPSCTVASAKFSSSAANVVNQTLFSSNDAELQRCLDALDFIPTIETAPDPRLNDELHQRKFQARVAALTPILTSCYTHHGGSALIAVEGLTTLLTTTDFFSPDVFSVSNAASGTNYRLTLLDLATQAVCDVAICTSRETSFGSCVDFVQHAVQYSRGHLNPRTIGYILRFYCFVFYFGASVPTPSKGPNPVWTSGLREQRESSAKRSIVAMHDLPLLYEGPLPSSKKPYLPGGAPQASALALKELISLTIGRVSLKSSADTESFGVDVHALTSSEPFGAFIQSIISTLIDGAAHRVDMANYTQLALHQVSRSGGSELFWSDMLKSCGAGLFATADNLTDELNSAYIVSFALLANLVKMSSGRIRHIPLMNELVPRDVASKLLGLELLHHFINQWKDHQRRVGGSIGLSSADHLPAVGTMAFSIRRLVVPCLLMNTESCLEDGRVFRRIIRIISELWRSPYYRRHMKMEIGVVINHFALRILRLGPQIFSPDVMGALENKALHDTAASSSVVSQSKVPLLSQQIDLLFEISRWFNSNSSDAVEFFLNFDTDMSSHESVMSQMLPGTQWRLCQHLSGAICTIAEESGDLLCQQIRASRVSNSVPPPSPTAATAAVFFSFQLPLEGSGEVAEKMMREGSRHLQQAAFDALTRFLKSLANSAATAMGMRYQELLSGWEGEDECEAPGQSDFNLTVSTPPSVGKGVAGSASPRSYSPWKALTSKREEAWRQERQHRLPETTEDGIVGYWQSEIAAERRKAAFSPQRPARKHFTSSPSQPYRHTSGDGEKNILRYGQSGSGAEFSKSNEAAHDALPSTEDFLPVAFEIARAKSLKKAVDYLIACDFLTPSPRDVAAFLRLHRMQLDPSSLGVFLAEGGNGGGDVEYWNQIRFNYFRPISFVGMNVEKGLRHFLTNCGFRLPGEAQQIDRIMTSFAQCYWEDNAGDLNTCPFRDQDTVFLIAFAIIMLNTDLHKSHGHASNSRKQRKRMTKQEFLNNLRGVDNNEDISRDYLAEVYDSIEEHPITMLMTTDDASAVTGSLGFSYHEASNEMMSLDMHLLEALKNAKMSEELLRSVSVHEHPFYTVEDFGRNLGYESHRDALADLARSVVSTTWHHFHGLIHSVLDVAHLDPRGMEMSLDLLQYALCTTICLDMTMERIAFLTQLARLKMFRARRGSRFASAQEHQAYRTEDWYVKLERNCADPTDDEAKLYALADVHDMILELHDSLRIDVDAKREMNRVVRRIRQGEFLLNDPTRFFLREGDLVKRSNRTGRSTSYRFFLFSDVIIYASATTSHDNFKIHEELPLHLMKITDWFPDRRQQMKKAFQVHHPRKSFIVFADSVEERQSWVKDIREAIAKEVERLTHLENARLAAASVER